MTSRDRFHEIAIPLCHSVIPSAPSSSIAKPRDHNALRRPDRSEAEWRDLLAAASLTQQLCIDSITPPPIVADLRVCRLTTRSIPFV